MKYKLLIILISLNLSFVCKGQEYDSLVKPGKKWYYATLFGGERYTYPAGSITILKNTRIYKGLTYYKLKASYDSLWIREEAKRVYVLNRHDTINYTNEVLMYDFNLERGDTFKFRTQMPQDSFENARLIVDTTFLQDNRKHIKFKLGYINDHRKYFSLISEWTEGIGGSQILYYSFNFHAFIAGENMTYVHCLFDNNKQILPVSGKCDSLLSFPIIDKANIKIYPNPTQNHFNIQLPTTKQYFVQVFNSLGQKVDELELEGKLSYSLTCPYVNGIYFLKIEDGKSLFQTKFMIE